jgi:hypothetical protein
MKRPEATQTGSRRLRRESWGLRCVDSDHLPVVGVQTAIHSVSHGLPPYAAKPQAFLSSDHRLTAYGIAKECESTDKIKVYRCLLRQAMPFGESLMLEVPLNHQTRAPVLPLIHNLSFLRRRGNISPKNTLLDALAFGSWKVNCRRAWQMRGRPVPHSCRAEE